MTFTLIGTTAAAATCSSDNNNTSAHGGTSGTSHGGTSGGGAGTNGAAGTNGNAGNGGTGTAAGCTDPLPETQAAADHTHTIMIPASTLDMTTAQTFDTSAVLGHMHMVTLEPANLTTLKGGGMVTVTSTSAGTPAHTHMFTISCH
ncbi:MAG TPA: hypothetical protein VN903_13050 [Polyangia bacterium]|nr:hypothetical protein [Polyangia bacterium]